MAKRQGSNEILETDSPPKKKACVEVQFNDESDDEVEATVPIDIDEITSESDSETKEAVSPPATNANSKMKHEDLNDRRLRGVIKGIFNQKSRELTLRQIGVPDNAADDVLKNSTLERVEDILEEIRALLESTASNRDGKQLLKLSFDYYSLVPTVAPIPAYIAGKLQLFQKYQTLNVLRALKESSELPGLAEQYTSLNCKLRTLDRSADSFKQILQAIGSTNYPRVPCIVKDIFSVERTQTDFEVIEPRRLLWHGCVLSLVPKILRAGLTIPKFNNPKSPCGNAIYFSEMFAEAAQHAKSFTVEDNPDCVVFLCEVSLGHSSCIRHKENFDSAPVGTNSVKCVGKSYPDPRNTLKMENGEELIAGKLVHNGVYGTEWDYNQYAIFDPKQVQIRYICLLELTGDDPAAKVRNPLYLPFGNIVSRGVWKYSSGSKWIPYEEQLSERLEECLQRNQKIVNVVIAGINYTINFDHMIQYQTQNPKKSRKIKRE